MLAEFLRKKRNLPGTKIVCAEGDCGACTLLKAAPYSAEKKPRYLPVNSCIIPVATLDGARLVTVEGLAQKKENSSELHPAQKAMLNCHGSQCGFCTPGFVMALAGLVENRIEKKQTESAISEKDARNALTANLCRCTGYQPILNAACSIRVSDCESVAKRYHSPALEKELKKAIQTPVTLKSDSFHFFAPTRLSEAAKFLKAHPRARILSGSTDLGVVHNKRKARLEEVVSLHLIPELYQLKKVGKNRIHVGARVTLSEVRDFVKKSLIPEFANFLDLFASPQIKNQATLIGNLANASPIGDTPPFLLVAGTVIHTWNSKLPAAKAKRKIPIEDFFLGYRKTALKPGEWITGLEFDIPSPKEKLSLKKISQRKDLDISTVNAAYRIEFDRSGQKIKRARIAYGGIAATPLRLPKIERALEGQDIRHVSIEKLTDLLQQSISPLSDVRSSSAFRRVTAENLLTRFVSSLKDSSNGETSQVAL